MAGAGWLMQGTRLLMAGGIRVRCSPAGRLQATARVGASWRACGERCLLWEGHRPALLEGLGEGRARGIPSEAAELTFASLGSDSPRLFRNTPHASWERGRITTERQNQGGRNRLRTRFRLWPPACGWKRTPPVSRQRPISRHDGSRGCVGHSWRRRGLSERSEFRSLQKECPARHRQITSAMDKGSA